MNKKNSYSTLQLSVLVLLRFIIGWHLLYEGIIKILDPSWSSRAFLMESKWILAGFSSWLMSNDQILNVVDFLNSWGLAAIGTGLILGLFSRIASISGAVLLLIYYLNSPPLPGLEYAMPMEGNYLIINKTLVEAISLIALAVFPTSKFIGLDKLLHQRKT